MPTAVVAAVGRDILCGGVLSGPFFGSRSNLQVGKAVRLDFENGTKQDALKT